MPVSRIEFFAAVGVLSLALVTHAQVITGTISGSVRDGTGAVLPGASLVVLNEDTGITRTIQTDPMGRYQASMLPLGDYRVTASVEGFQAETRRGISLTVGRQAVLDFTLAVGAVSQTVEVTGEAPLIETRESSVSYLVNENTISELPLNGRDITELILLNPGVSLAPNSATGNAYVGFGKKISIGGMRGEDNAYLLDGGYINDMNRHLPSGPSGALLGSETVREFQVLTNNYSAQYGRALGGVFNAVSKSGTNSWHGSAFEYLRNSALDARRFFDAAVSESDPDKPPFRRNSFGATLGGPIQRDRAFFFTAYEATRESRSTTEYRVVFDDDARRGNLPGRTAFTPSALTAPYLALYPRATPGAKNFGDGTQYYIFSGSNPAREDYGQGRMDYQLSDKGSLFGRLTASNANKTETGSFPGYDTTRFMNTRLLTVSETHILSPTMLNTIRVSFNRVDPGDRGTYPKVDSSILSVPGAPVPDISPAGGVAGMTGAPKPLDRWVTNRYNFQNDASWTLGGHSLQFGGMAERLQFNMINPNRPQGSWTWANFVNFLQGAVPRSYRGTPDAFGDPSRGFRQWFFGFYLQDDWQLTSRLTLNLGLRWEPYTVPGEVNGKIANQRRLMDARETLGGPYWLNQSWTDLGPRVGFAWSPTDSGRTSIRGGVGLFFLPNDPTVYRTQATRNQLFPEYNFTTVCCFPDALRTIAAAPTGQAPEAIPYENLKSARAVQYNLNVQRQLDPSTVVTVGYTGSRGLNQTLFGDYNVPMATYNGVSLEAPIGAARPNRNYQAINYYANGADSWYNGFTLALQRRFAGGLQTQVSYTWSKALSTSDTTSKTDSSGAGGGSPKYTLDLRTAKGYSGYHLAHVMSINYLYELPFGRNLSGVAGHLLSGWQLTGIISLQTGQPFHVSQTASAALTPVGLTQSPILNNSFTRDKIILGEPNEGQEKYFDTGAFRPAGERELGNVVKNFLIGPGMAKWDFSVSKNASLGESLRMQFRTELFNVFNRANFAAPAATVFNATRALQPTAGVINDTVTNGRQIQFGLKLTF